MNEIILKKANETQEKINALRNRINKLENICKDDEKVLNMFVELKRYKYELPAYNELSNDILMEKSETFKRCIISSGRDILLFVISEARKELIRQLDIFSNL